MTRNTLLAVGLGGVVATTIGIATAQPSIADSFIRTINYTTSPVVVEKAACTHARVLTAPVVVEKTLESPAVIRSTTGAPFMVEQRVMHRPLLHKVVERPALIEVNKVVERPVVIQRVISQPTVIEKFVEKPAIVDCVISQPAVIAHPTVIRKSVTSPVIILDDDRFLYDFSTHRKLKIDLDD